MMTSGFGCSFLSEETKQALEPVTLEYWRVWDDRSDFSAIISAYQQLHPNVRINYRKFRYEEYEDALLEAFAADKGPDIFSIHNSWMLKYKDFIQPMPQTITLPYRTIEGTIRPEEVIKLRTNPTMSLRELKNQFVETVYDEVVFSTEVSNDPNVPPQDLIYGLPLSLDTMALYYNRDLLNNAGIVNPPTDWTSFQEDIVKITKLDEDGNLLLSGAAIGTGENISRSADLISLLMMQNRAQMTDDGGNIVFNQIPAELSGRTISPGEEALRFYTDFASPVKEVYTWNNDQPDSIEAFAAGETAFMFGYAYHKEQIDTLAPRLNYSIAPMPQIEGNPPVNYANYWIETVSNKTADINEAWDFIMFATAEEQVDSYLNNTEKPTALRNLIEEQTLDDNLLPFASQILTARTWYKGEDPNTMEQVFIEMIDSVVNGEVIVKDALDLAVNRVRQTLKVKKPYEF